LGITTAIFFLSPIDLLSTNGRDGRYSISAFHVIKESSYGLPIPAHKFRGVIPAKAGTQVGTGFRIKSGMTTSMVSMAV